MVDSGFGLLTGEYRNTLDEKGRILFPSKMRTEISSNILIVTQAVDRCLWLFTPEEWKKLSSKLMESSSPFNERNRIVLRRFIAPAQEVVFDKSGRISVPQSLRAYAGLTKDCVILGVDKYIELWDAAAYDSYLNDTEDFFKQAAEELKTINF